jgi:prophage DNA circulation protein
MPSWRDNLVPATFRGVPFHWDTTSRRGGRRVAKFELPKKNRGYLEDLGRRLGEFPMTGYVLGENYMDLRAQLEEALDADGPGTLQHPYRGALTVICETWLSNEVQKEGRMARFDMHFLLWAPRPAPRAVADTAGVVGTAATNAQGALATAFGNAFSLANAAAFVQQAANTIVAGLATATSALQAAVGAVNGVLSGDLTALSGVAAQLGLDGGNVAAGVTSLAGDVFAVFNAASSAIANAEAAVALAISLVPSATTENSSVGTPPPSDPTYGLAAFATYGASLPAVPVGTLDQVAMAANQAALVQMIQGSAVIAISQLYQASTFASSADAGAARDQITGMIDTQMLAATDDNLVQAWTALYAAVATDLTTRGKQLPSLVQFTTPAPMPSLWLANRLYQDADRAAEICARNGIIDPAFCPTTIEALSA